MKQEAVKTKCKYCNANEGETHHHGCPDEYVFVPAFATKAELEKFLHDKTVLVKSKSGKWYEPGNYYLAHGEYERPDYVPTRYKDGWSLKVVYYFYAGTLFAPEDGRVEFITAIVPLD